ncbi:hypothetical protein GCM10027400_20200 [Pseudoxanthomonas daejeonensis]
MSKHLDIIRETFPSQTHLTPKQIARALHGPGKDTKHGATAIRQQLDNGTLIPGLRKAPGEKRWSVKVVDLAAALDGEVHRRPDMSGPVVLSGRRNSRFKNPGPRVARLWTDRSHAFWADLLEETLRLESESLRKALTGEVVDRPDREPGPGLMF